VSRVSALADNRHDTMYRFTPALFVPGVAFYKDNVDLASLRLSFAAPGVSDIGAGVLRLKRALDASSAV